MGKGNVFTPVCNSVHIRDGVSVPACTTGHMTRRGSLTRGVSVERFSVLGSLSKGGLCLGGVSVQRQVCPGSLCLGVSVQGGFSLRETPSYGSEQAVRTLLE